MNEGHISAMEAKHAELDAQLEAESNRPCPDDDLIHRIKKQKLHLKDSLKQEKALA